MKHGLGFLKLFVPQAPWYLLILLKSPSKVISRSSTAPSAYRSDCSPTCWPDTPCWRCLPTKCVALGGAGGALNALSIAPMLLIVAIMLLELLVAFLQAYVFAILTCIYLNEALHLHDNH